MMRLLVPERWLAVAFALLALAAAGAIMPSSAGAGAGLRGDANCNGRTDAIDSSLILQLDAGLTGGLACETLADVDRSGTTNSIDASIILQRVADLLPWLPAYVSLDLETPGPVDVGDEIVVEIRVEDVEHLAAFDFELSFDDAALSIVRFEDLGAFLDTGSRGHPICYPGPDDELDVYPRTATCATVGVPVCMGGASGPSGAGTLGRAVFRAERAGTASIQLSRSTLVWDDVFNCDPSRLDPVRIPHGRGGDVSIAVQ